jgi:hypothetical protein
MSEPIFGVFGMYIMAHEPLSTAYFINPFHQSACLYVYHRVLLLGNGSVDMFPWQRIHASTEELWEASFSIESLSYHRTACGSVYLLIVAMQWLGKHVPATTKTCWRRCFLCGPFRDKGKWAIISSQKSFLVLSTTFIN